jgi:DNA repair exonuclease SbcCD ATPase subunit
MKNLDFKYIKAENFLCFGQEPFELNFKDFSNIVLIKGNNLDVKQDSIDEKISSNGVGKSSIPEIIVYTLFGKTIKHPKKITHKDVINNQIGRNLRTEVIWGNFRVIRTRKPDSLKFWESSDHIWNENTELTLGGMPATQKLIEEKIGLNYETFVNILVFTDNNAGSFLECDSFDKRQIIENLLSLDKYRNFAEKAKDLKKEKKDNIKNVLYEFENFENQKKQLNSRLEIANNQENQWKKEKQTEILDLDKKIDIIKKELNSSDKGKKLNFYLDAQKEIETLSEQVDEIQKKQQEIDDILISAKEKLDLENRSKNNLDLDTDKINYDIEKNTSRIKEFNKEIDKFEKNKGQKCKFCLGEISEDNYKNYVKEIKNKIIELEKSKKDSEDSKNKIIKDKENILLKINKLAKGIDSAKISLEKERNSLFSKKKRLEELNKIQKPKDENTDNQILEEKINSLKEQIKSKKQELNKSPFIKIIESIYKDIQVIDENLINKKLELENIEKELPYYDFWVTAFGDSGIRKFVIDEIMPALNSNISHWLQFLIDGKIKLEFNNELEEKIERFPSDGDPFVYHAMSGGERRRLNLAVSQAFAHIMALSSGVLPSIVFLDEVTTNIDPIGVYGVYNMIMELSKDRKVFITTHDQNLLELLEGCELINLEKKSGFTKIKK